MLVVVRPLFSLFQLRLELTWLSSFPADCAFPPLPPLCLFPSIPLTSSPTRCTCLQQASTGVYLKLHIDRLRKVPLLIHKLTGRLYPVVGAVQILLGVQTWWGLCLGEEALQCYAHHVRAPSRSREVWYRADAGSGLDRRLGSRTCCTARCLR